MLELSFEARTGLAALHIVMRPDLAPQTVAAVVAAIGDAPYTATTSPYTAAFYRNEAIPATPPARCGDIPCGPYALVQVTPTLTFALALALALTLTLAPIVSLPFLGLAV